MKSITRLVTAVAVMFAVATLCPAQDVKPTDLGKGAACKGRQMIWNTLASGRPDASSRNQPVIFSATFKTS